MKNQDFYVGLFMTALSTGTAIMAYRLGLGTIDNPGAGLLPFGTALLLGLMSIGLIFKSLRAVLKKGRMNPFKGILWRSVLLIPASLVGYGLLLHSLGFTISTFLLLVFLLTTVGHRKWWVTLAVAGVTVGIAYLIFVAWLDVQLPKGLLGG